MKVFTFTKYWAIFTEVLKYLSFILRVIFTLLTVKQTFLKEYY